MQQLEGYLHGTFVFLVALAGTIGFLLWGTTNGDRSSLMENSVKLQQKYKFVYDRIQYGASYQEIDALLQDRLRVYCNENSPQTAPSTDRWCHWQGAPALTLSIQFNGENRAIEKQLYYDKVLGLESER